MSLGVLVQLLRETADLLDAYAPTTDTLRSLARTKNAIDAAQARLVGEMVEHVDHEAEGYSSAKAWLRDQLQLDTGDATQLIKAGRTLRDLPDVDAAASRGEVSAKHLKVFTYSIKHLGHERTTTATEYLVPVAQTATAGELHDVVKKLREAVYPDALEQQWLDGMAKRDITLTPVPGGFHVSGFLDTETGVKFTTVMHSAGTPRDAQDDRDTATRRIDGLEKILDAILANGLPADNGVRPHITLVVDLADLSQHPDTATGELAGFGTIGNSQLKRMLEIGDLTPILTGGKSTDVDVGRRQPRAKRCADFVCRRGGHERAQRARRPGAAWQR